MTDAGTKPYLIRAIHEWCSDKGFTPYLAVVVDQGTVVPREYVRNGEIVLNVSLEATNKLHLGNESIEFQARFSGKARDISIPIGNVSAIYARENGQGMSFDVSTSADEVLEGKDGTGVETGVKPSPAPGGVSEGGKRAMRLKSVGGPVQQDNPAEGVVSEQKTDPLDKASDPAVALDAIRGDSGKADKPVAFVPLSDDDGPKLQFADPTLDPPKPTGGKPRLTRVK